MGCTAMQLLFVVCVHLSVVTTVSLPALENAIFPTKDIAFSMSDAEDPKCYTRTLEDLTCFWDDSEESNSTYIFLYSFEQTDQKQCEITSQMITRNTTRHACFIPTDDILLFEPLRIEVTELSSDTPKFMQNLSVDLVVLLDPPSNVTVRLNRNPLQLRICWEAPTNPNIELFLLYEISYWIITTDSALEKKETVSRLKHHNLQNLNTGTRYLIRLRTKPDGMSFDGFWSPWSDTVSAVTPYSSGEINLRCSTADLQSITCQWKVNKTEADTLYSLYYQTSRELVWKICGNQRNSTIGYTIIYRCTFATSDVNETSIIVNASNPYYTQTFYEEHFRTDNVVRPDAPRIVKTVSTVGGKLRLIWEPPITKLLGHMIYQIRYSEQNGTSWKTLLIQKQLQSEMLDLPHSKTYYMQLRTKPNGIKYKGFWSSWSDTFTATIPGPMGVTTVALITGSVLLLVIALIMPRLIFPNAYSNVKKKLWPQIPNLDRLLEGYLSDFQKYPQPACDKHADDELLPSVLEIISERKGRNSARCVEKQEEVCQTDHLSASSIIRQHRASVTDGTLHGETKSSSNSSQNYILLDLQGSLPFLQEDIDFDKKDKSSSFQESQSLQWLHNPNSKNQNKTIQKDIHWIKPPPFSVQSINSIGTKQQSLTPLVCYDDMFTFFGHFRFPVSVDYRSMSAMDISNHSYLMASDFKPGIFSLRSSLAKE